MKRKHPKVFQGYRVLYLLMSTKDPYTIHEIAHDLQISPVTAYRHLRELWSMDFIHISGWDRTYRHWMPVYQWGEGKDKSRPKPLTRVQIARRKATARSPKDEVSRALKNIYNYRPVGAASKGPNQVSGQAV